MEDIQYIARFDSTAASHISHLDPISNRLAISDVISTTTYCLYRPL